MFVRYAPDPEVVRHFLRLHEPSIDDWTAVRAELEVTDGCPLNGVYGGCSVAAALLLRHAKSVLTRLFVFRSF